MKKTKLVIFTFGILLIAVHAFSQQQDAKYFGETPPGTTPKVFARGKVSSVNQFEFGAVFSNDNREFYYGVEIDGKAETRMMKFENGKWSQPTKILSHEVYSYNDPFLTPDNSRLFFISNRSMAGTGPKKIITSGTSNAKLPENGLSQRMRETILIQERMSITSPLQKPEKCISHRTN